MDLEEHRELPVGQALDEVGAEARTRAVQHLGVQLPHQLSQIGPRRPDGKLQLDAPERVNALLLEHLP